MVVARFHHVAGGIQCIVQVHQLRTAGPDITHQLFELCCIKGRVPCVGHQNQPAAILHGFVYPRFYILQRVAFVLWEHFHALHAAAFIRDLVDAFFHRKAQVKMLFYGVQAVRLIAPIHIGIAAHPADAPAAHLCFKLLQGGFQRFGGILLHIGFGHRMACHRHAAAHHFLQLFHRHAAGFAHKPRRASHGIRHTKLLHQREQHGVRFAAAVVIHKRYNGFLFAAARVGQHVGCGFGLGGGAVGPVQVHILRGRLGQHLPGTAARGNQLIGILFPHTFRRVGLLAGHRGVVQHQVWDVAADALHAIPHAAHRNAAAVGCLRCGGGRHRYGVPCIRQHRCPLRLGVRGKRDIQRKAIPPGAAPEMQNLHAIAGFGAKAQHTHGAAKNFRVISFQFNFVGHSIPPYDPFET